MRRIGLAAVTLLILLFLMTACQPVLPENAPEMANPASVYCEEQGGTLDIRTADDGGQYGICIFDDGSECEEWAYFRDECQPGTE